MLIDVAYKDVLASPDGPLMKRVMGLSEAVRIYHIRHSVRRLPPAGRVGRPSHVVAFRFDAETVIITDLLHEVIDLPSRLK